LEASARFAKGILHTKIFCEDVIDLDVLKREAIKIKKFIERAMKFAKGLNKNGAHRYGILQSCGDSC
jgi:hypothetical protein